MKSPSLRDAKSHRQTRTPIFGSLSELTERYSVSASTLYRMSRCDPRFPKARRLPTGSRIWSVTELDQYFEDLPKEVVTNGS